MENELILASKSPARQTLMRNAGLSFRCVKAKVDERSLDVHFDPKRPKHLVRMLAREKALAVSRQFPKNLVIGADQIAIFEDRLLHQPGSLDKARAQLLELRGHRHQLISAFCLAHHGQALSIADDTAELTMRTFDEDELDDVLALDGDEMMHCAGSYRLEGPALHLFEAIDGDYFTILGLPMLQLLAALRQLKARTRP